MLIKNTFFFILFIITLMFENRCKGMKSTWLIGIYECANCVHFVISLLSMLYGKHEIVPIFWGTFLSE